MVEKGDRREEKRKRIMQAALKIFSRKGYTPAAVDEVAAEAGIGKGTLYLYFKDKEELFFSTIMSVVEDLASMIQSEIPDGLSSVEALFRLVRLQFEFFSRNRDFFNIYLTILNYNLLSNYTDLFQSLVDKQKLLYEFEVEIVEKGKREGYIRKDIETGLIVSSFQGMIHDVVAKMCFDNTSVSFDVDEKAKLVMKLFLEGAGTSSGLYGRSYSKWQ
ncbi:MAG: TetR/AcrR family transcriptional regulator [Spirochaetota bacterium]